MTSCRGVFCPGCGQRGCPNEKDVELETKAAPSDSAQGVKQKLVSKLQALYDLSATGPVEFDKGPETELKLFLQQMHTEIHELCELVKQL